ncbi:hypothetical protein BSK49_01055 [Paenibacillus odorifer]|uniref:hypothetical protein n=1 Tax=Paenibacillus odorifer TaxID=189426 RepID=UPI00096F58CA|nr:hypothetical protein [Paenibacillus odorifer]OMD93002.1 hypothetical protein BSK49_01055 [Paenibacillus odorifer]
MWPLSLEEKSKSQVNRKLANKLLLKADKSLGYKSIKGSPVILSLDGSTIVLDYDLLRKLYRTLKNRHVNTKIEWRGSAPVLMIYHHTGNWSKDTGTIELKQLPSYKMELLTDLPIIELNTD